MAIKNLLLQFRQLPRLWKLNKYDFTVWIATLLSGVFIDFPYALYCGVGLSIFLVVYQSQRGNFVLFGKLKNEDLYVEESQQTTLSPNVKIFKMESSLYFATAESFKENLYRLTWDPRGMGKGPKEVTVTVNKTLAPDGQQAGDLECERMESKYVIIDCSSFNYVDLTGMSALSAVVKEYRHVGIEVLLVRCTNSLLALMKRSELLETVGKEHVFPDIVDAITATAADN